MVTQAELNGVDALDIELQQLQTALQPFQLPAGTRVFEQGEAGDRLLLIADGRARSSLRLPTGGEQTLSVSGPGDVVGEIALLTGARRAATVTAITPLRGWTLDRHGFGLLRWDSRRAAIAVVQRLVALTTARLRAHCAQIAQLTAHPVDLSGLPTSTRRAVPMPALDYLASLLCFSGFPRVDDVEAAVRGVPVHAAERGDVLVVEGSRPPGLLLVVRGAVEVMVNHDGSTHRVRLAGPGRFVAHNGILDDGPSPVTARCREPAVLFSFPRANVRAQLNDSARLARAFSAAVLEDTARAVRQASRPMLFTTARK